MVLYWRIIFIFNLRVPMHNEPGLVALRSKRSTSGTETWDGSGESCVCL